MRHKSLDDFLILIMAVAGLGSIYMLYGQKYFQSQTHSEERVASIVDQFKTVKRKRDFYQGWVDVDHGDVLEMNDEIYTHEQSSARIKFERGPEINLFENSLLKIKKTDSAQPTLALERGNLNAELRPNQSTLNVELANKKYTLNSQSANIQIEQGSKENKFMVLEGTAEFQSGQEKTQLTTDQILIEDKAAGKIEVKKLTLKQISPKNASRFFIDDQFSIQFKIKKSMASDAGELHISRLADFSTPLLIKSIEAETIEANFSEEGTYFWKLISPDGLNGPVRSFTIIKEKPLIVSADRTVVTKAKNQTNSVFINWKTAPGEEFKKYQIQINEKTVVTNLSHYEWSPEKTGQYQLRIKGFEESRPHALWSEPIQLSVIEERPVELKNLMPDDLQIVAYDEGAIKHSFQWDGPIYDFNYTVTLKGAGQTYNFKTLSPNTIVHVSKPGNYQWTIQGVSPSGIKTNILQGKITFKKPLSISQLPSAGAVIELDRPDQLVKFAWKEFSNADYHFELAEDDQFQKILKDEVLKSPSINTVVGRPGKYFWRVKVKGAKGEEYSRPVSVELKPSPPLQAPDQLPDLNLKLRYQTTPSSTFFKILDFFVTSAIANEPIAETEWTLPAQTRAKEYVVEIYADKEKTKLIQRLQTKEPKVIWKQAIPGTFYWQVAYIDFWGRQTEFSKLSKLVVENDEEAEKEAFTTMELESPAHRENILEKSDSSAQFSWKSNSAKDYIFLVANDLDFEKVIVAKKTKKEELTLTCLDLQKKPGEYYWKVTSGKFSSKRRMFVAKCETPPAPIILAEEKKSVEAKSEETITAKEIALSYIPSRNILRAGLAPHKLSYSNKATQYEAKVDGTVTSGFFLDYHRELSSGWIDFFDAGLRLSRGKVFEKITFTDLDAKLKFMRQTSFLNYGVSVSALKRTLYEEAGSTINDAGETLPLLGLGLSKDTESFLFALDVRALSAINISAEAAYKINRKWIIGPFFESMSIDKDAGKHSFTTIGLKMGTSFDFDQAPQTE